MEADRRRRALRSEVDPFYLRPAAEWRGYVSTYNDVPTVEEPQAPLRDDLAFVDWSTACVPHLQFHLTLLRSILVRVAGPCLHSSGPIRPHGATAVDQPCPVSSTLEQHRRCQTSDCDDQPENAHPSRNQPREELSQPAVWVDKQNKSGRCYLDAQHVHNHGHLNVHCGRNLRNLEKEDERRVAIVHSLGEDRAALPIDCDSIARDRLAVPLQRRCKRNDFSTGYVGGIDDRAVAEIQGVEVWFDRHGDVRRCRHHWFHLQ